jgi:hypothetical protein
MEQRFYVILDVPTHLMLIQGFIQSNSVSLILNLCSYLPTQPRCITLHGGIDLTLYQRCNSRRIAHSTVRCDISELFSADLSSTNRGTRRYHLCLLQKA